MSDVPTQRPPAEAATMEPYVEPPAAETTLTSSTKEKADNALGKLKKRFSMLGSRSSSASHNRTPSSSVAAGGPPAHPAIAAAAAVPQEPILAAAAAPQTTQDDLPPTPPKEKTDLVGGAPTAAPTAAAAAPGSTAPAAAPAAIATGAEKPVQPVTTQEPPVGAVPINAPVTARAPPVPAEKEGAGSAILSDKEAATTEPAPASAATDVAPAASAASPVSAAAVVADAEEKPPATPEKGNTPASSTILNGRSRDASGGTAAAPTSVVPAAVTTQAVTVPTIAGTTTPAAQPATTTIATDAPAPASVPGAAPDSAVGGSTESNTKANGKKNGTTKKKGGFFSTALAAFSTPLAEAPLPTRGSNGSSGRGATANSTETTLPAYSEVAGSSRSGAASAGGTGIGLGSVGRKGSTTASLMTNATGTTLRAGDMTAPQKGERGKTLYYNTTPGVGSSFASSSAAGGADTSRVGTASTAVASGAAGATAGSAAPPLPAKDPAGVTPASSRVLKERAKVLNGQVSEGRPPLIDLDARNMPNYEEFARTLGPHRKSLRGLYPALEPFKTGFMKMDDTHTVYWEQCGKPDGVPVCFIHGGPGGGITPGDRRWFDPEHYQIILFDQRGAGRSTPSAELKDNTTWDLVDDMERIRNHFGFRHWILFGGSWGSTLALAYAQTHPERTLGLILRGIFTLRKSELAFFYQHGSSFLYPEIFDYYQELIPKVERDDFVKAYYKRLTHKDERIRLEAARRWSTWENATSKLYLDKNNVAKGDDDKWALAFARIEAHFFHHHGFMSDGQLLDQKNIDLLREWQIPCFIVQGRYDVVCPMKSAWDLHKAWPEAEFHVVPDAGHSAREPGIAHWLVEATDKFKEIEYEWTPKQLLNKLKPVDEKTA